MTPADRQRLQDTREMLQNRFVAFVVGVPSPRAGPVERWEHWKRLESAGMAFLSAASQAAKSEGSAI